MTPVAFCTIAGQATVNLLQVNPLGHPWVVAPNVNVPSALPTGVAVGVGVGVCVGVGVGVSLGVGVGVSPGVGVGVWGTVGAGVGVGIGRVLALAVLEKFEWPTELLAATR